MGIFAKPNFIMAHKFVSLQENLCTMQHHKYIAIDIGGSWIKGIVTTGHTFSKNTNRVINSFNIQRVKSPFHNACTVEQLLAALNALFTALHVAEDRIYGIAISTPGVVNYGGTKVLNSNPKLKILENELWLSELKTKFNCPVHLINDADATAIGLCETAFCSGKKRIGIMPIGTGLGFSIWNNGRRWRPNKTLPLLGSVIALGNEYNELASATKLAQMAKTPNLIEVLTNHAYLKERNTYFNNLSDIIKTATTLYNLDEVVIAGGIVDAANSCNFSIFGALTKHLEIPPHLPQKAVNIKIAEHGNALQLLGCLALIHGEIIAKKNNIDYKYSNLDTELPYDNTFRPEQLDSLQIISALWNAEQLAGKELEKSLKAIALIVDDCVENIKSGGRIIYVGSGTSGRIAALDAVEVPCTYGFPEDKIITLISGGLTEACMQIETDFEEDASAVPEALLLNIMPNDVVIGISASGTSYYVRSALSLAKEKKAMTVMVQANYTEKAHKFCDHVIALGSGKELICGSTRMKAGTATKKVLNFLSTTLMIKLGKVVGPYMVDLACTNKKLVQRAVTILEHLYAMESSEAMHQLMLADMQLSKVIDNVK